MPRVLLVLAALAAAATSLAATASPATASSPCWRQVVQDWSDHRTITGHYSPRCLRQAIKHAPEDLRDYSPLIDDISALLYDSGGQGGGNRSPGGGNGEARGASPTDPAAAAKKRAQRANRAVPRAGTSGSIPDQSRAVPLPLVLLGALGLAAALATAAPPLIKRLRGRFPRLRPAAGSVRPPS